MSGRSQRTQNQPGQNRRGQEQQNREQQPQPKGQMLELINEMSAEVRLHRDAFTAAMPRGVSPQQIMQDAHNCLRSTKNLPLVYRPTFVAALLTCASLGLRPGVPGLGHAWILPFRNFQNNGRLEAQLIIGYKGYADLAYRHTRVVGIASNVVRSRDTFEIDLGDDKLTHKTPPFGVPRGPAIGFYAFAKVQGPYGTERILTEPMSAAEMEEHRDEHAMHKEWVNGRRVVAGVWLDHFDEMGRKTMIRLRLMKSMPVALDLATAAVVDEGVRYDLNPEADPAKVTERPSTVPPPLDPHAPVRDSVVIRTPDRQGGITPDQDRRIAQLMRQRGMSKNDALDLVEKTVGERLSARQLNEEQAGQVIDAIQAIPPDPIGGTVLTPDREENEQRIVALFDGLDTRLGADRRLRDLSTLVGRDVRTSADVNDGELGDIADVLTACKGQTAEWDAAVKAAADQRKASGI
ncbi:recombinase RecT [Nonomuraea fuscirosea]|uniref:recombinase RecT n=1 Tax=Nonomuraea fuscirosea TaxID=1291556 RepID=UPI0033D2A832